MGNVYNAGFVTVLAAGAQQASGAASARLAIPTNFSGALPRYVRVAATAAACIRLGNSSVVATAADTQVQPGDALIMAVSECTHFAVIQVSTGGLVQVSPLENL